MADLSPIVTVIIPARPEQKEIKALAAARLLDYPKDRLEIIIARGRQPSVQRNAAIRRAKGDWIYFLDDDSTPARDNLLRASPLFADSRLQMLGGPNLCPPGAPRLEQLFALTMGNPIAFGPSAARYRSMGQRRESSEKELILCNLLARRATLLQLGGFDESLYPNEENALMDQIQKTGGKLVYDPDLVVHRRPRPTLKAFIKMLMTYGRGRAEQFRLHPTTGSALNFAPPLFCLFLLLIVAGAVSGLLPRTAGPLIAGTLGAYLLLIFLVAVWFSGTKGWLSAPLIVCAHLFYGIGFWRGLFTSLKASGTGTKPEVNLEVAS